MLYIKGLKSSAFYYLKETQAPSGYNLTEPAITTIDTHLITDSHRLLTYNDNSSIEVKNAAKGGNYYVAIENRSGITLPETGGTGVLILKILGIVGMAAAIVVVSVVLFAPKKKKRSK